MKYILTFLLFTYSLLGAKTPSKNIQDINNSTINGDVVNGDKTNIENQINNYSAPKPKHFYLLLNYNKVNATSKIENYGDDDEVTTDLDISGFNSFKLGYRYKDNFRLEVGYTNYSSEKKGVNLGFIYAYKDINKTSYTFAPYIGFEIEYLSIDDNNLSYETSGGGSLGVGTYIKVNEAVEFQVGYKATLHLIKLERDEKICDPHSYYYEDCEFIPKSRLDIEVMHSLNIGVLIFF